MDNKLTKSLTDLIDETLMELDELRKSRFAASEIKIEGPGDGIAGKPSDGKLDAAKAEDKKEDDKSDDKDEKDEAKKGENEEAAKGENEEAAKAEDMDKKEDKDEDKKDKKDEDAKGGEKHEAQERKAISKLADLADMKKSIAEESESLMKSYVEERVKPLEDKLSTILDLVNKIAEQPVAPKGQTARTAPLFKSADDGASEPLSKAQVASKLFELKKSGTRVDSLDITKAEMGQDLQQIAKKYEIS
jgi:hypothetical protein